MLIIKAFVNKNQIDEIHIWNTGNCVDEEYQTYEYQIQKPKGYEDYPIFHSRELGWKALTLKVLEILEGLEPIGEK